jgi:chromosomal replication initiator protein
MTALCAQDNQNSHMDNDLQSCWPTVLANLSERLQEGVFKNWIATLAYHDFNMGTLILASPTRFTRDWVRAHYAQDVLKAAQEIEKSILNVDFIVSADVNKSKVPDHNVPVKVKDIDTTDPKFLDYIAGELDPRLTFENFVVGKSNELAYTAARRVAESEKVTYNPLFLYGGVGLGKTHLMHALGWHIKECHPERKVMYISAEKFMYQFIRALRYRDTVAFKEQFRTVDVLMIDDVQFISGKESTQEEFFHTFNALVDKNHQVIVSADKSPSDLEGMEERLKSRLGWGLVADIHPTTYELRLGIIQSKAEGLGEDIPLNVMEYLAHKISSNIRELEGALNRVVAHCTLMGREMTIEMAQEILRDLVRANDRRISIDDIQRKVSEHFNVKLSEMQSTKRSRIIARPRQIAMYLSKELTSRSLPDIGRSFGGRDHSTVVHAVKKVNELMQSDTSIAEDVELLKRALQN